MLVGTPGRSKTPKLLRTVSHLGECVPGIRLDGRSRLNVRKSFGVFFVFECQLIWDQLYLDHDGLAELELPHPRGRAQAHQT